MISSQDAEPSEFVFSSSETSSALLLHPALRELLVPFVDLWWSLVRLLRYQLNCILNPRDRRD